MLAFCEVRDWLSGELPTECEGVGRLETGLRKTSPTKNLKESRQDPWEVKKQQQSLFKTGD